MGTSWHLISDLDALARAAGDRGLVTVVDAPTDLELTDAMGEAVLRCTEDALEGAVADPDARIVLITVTTERGDVVVDVLHDGLGDGACRRFVVPGEPAELRPLPPGAPRAPVPRRR